MFRLEEFAQMKRDNDILVRCHRIAKTPGHFAYLTHRNTKTDFPVLAVSAVKDRGRDPCGSIGARPMKAEAFWMPEIWKRRVSKETGSAGEDRQQYACIGEIPFASGRGVLITRVL